VRRWLELDRRIWGLRLESGDAYVYLHDLISSVLAVLFIL
jgi:hypothetical protein